jgi:hypothetical protein
LKSGFGVYVHDSLEEESEVIEIYTSTTLRVLSSDGVKIEPDAEQAIISPVLGFLYETSA